MSMGKSVFIISFNKAMEKAEKMWGAKEDVLWGYPGKNFNTNSRIFFLLPGSSIYMNVLAKLRLKPWPRTGTQGREFKSQCLMNLKH